MWLLIKMNNLLAQLQTPGQAPSPATPMPVDIPGAVPVSPPAVPINFPPSSAMPQYTFIQYLFLAVYFLVCAGLVVLVLVQTSKSEGLSGTLGGATQSIFRGKRSFEEKLNQITAYVATAFIVGSILISLFAF